MTLQMVVTPLLSLAALAPAGWLGVVHHRIEHPHKRAAVAHTAPRAFVRPVSNAPTSRSAA